MELRQLRYFIAVAEELHFGRAAQRVGIEQSPLSRAIQELERDVGVQLLRRTSRRTDLTAAGRTLLQNARRILTAVEHTRLELRREWRASGGQMRIGICDGLGPERLARLLAACRREEPDVDIRLIECPHGAQVEDIRLGLLDVGFTLAASGGSHDVRAEAIWLDPVMVALPSGHGLATRRIVHLADIAREPLILYDRECPSGINTQIDRLIRSVNGRPIVVDHVLNVDTLLTLVGAGHGIGLISKAQRRATDLQNATLRQLHDSTAILTTYLISRDDESSPLVQRFCARARQLPDQPVRDADSDAAGPDRGTTSLDRNRA